MSRWLPRHLVDCEGLEPSSPVKRLALRPPVHARRVNCLHLYHAHLEVERQNFAFFRALISILWPGISTTSIALRGGPCSQCDWLSNSLPPNRRTSYLGEMSEGQRGPGKNNHFKTLALHSPIENERPVHAHPIRRGRSHTCPFLLCLQFLLALFSSP